MPWPQLLTTERSAMPETGTITVTNSQARIKASASHFHGPSISGRWRADLPFIATKRCADLSRARCSSTSGKVTAMMQVATAAIRW